MSALENNKDLTKGSVTSYKMQEALKQIYQNTIMEYENYESDTRNELIRTEEELGRLERDLEKKIRITDSLKREKEVNDQELERLGIDYNNLNSELKQLTLAFE